MSETHLVSKWFISLLLLALIFRLALMPFSLHTDPRFTGDIIEFNRAASAIYSGDAERLWYPPLLYFSVGLFQRAMLPERPLFVRLPIQGKENQLSLLSSPAIFRTLILLKVWYLAFDMGVAFLLCKILCDKSGRILSLLWLFNPIIIYNAYFHGQFDVMPLFFITLALYFAKEGQADWAAFWMGIAACCKNFPFLLLLPAIIVLAETWRKRLGLLLLGTLPYLVLMLPFLDQYGTSLSSYSSWFFKAGYDLGSSFQVYFFLVFYAVLLWRLYHHKACTFGDLWRACFAILLVYYSFSYFDLHYWAWIVPFVLFDWSENKTHWSIYVLGLILLFAVAAPAPLARFISPVSPRFFLNLPSILETLAPYVPMFLLTNLARSALYGTCFYLAWRLLREVGQQAACPALQEAG